ncbi:MAG TPA: DUF4097 family beta strand repeat-containing protein [Acidimicrobiales bacterium]|nr:DUF4097 family beta strand repeat-containing protein [Acidimicrobiales bacterium]
MEKTFETEGPIEAEVRVPAGVIEVQASDANTAAVLLEPVRASRGAHELLADTEVSLVGGTLRVHVPDRTLRNVDIRCSLRLPGGSALATRTASADVAVSMALRAFEGTTASGDVTLGDVAQDVSHRSASGDFKCGTVGGRLHVRTASGDVAVRRASGRVELALASGDAHVEDAEGSVGVRSASGDVRLDCVRRGRVHAATASGDVTVGVAAGVAAHLDVTTVSGDTGCMLPFDEHAGASDPALEIVARTVSGDVVVRGAGR